MTCAKCSAEIPEGQKFCGGCGQAVADPAAAPAAAPAPAPTAPAAPPPVPIDFAKLFGQIPLSEKIAGGAFLVAFISVFLPWYSISFGGSGGLAGMGSMSVNGLKFTFGVFYFLLALAGLGAIGVGTFSSQAQLKRMSGFALLGTAGASILCALLALTEPSGGPGMGHMSGGMGFGWILSLLAALGAGAGAFLKARESGLVKFPPSAPPPPSAPVEPPPTEEKK